MDRVLVHVHFPCWPFCACVDFDVAVAPVVGGGDSTCSPEHGTGEENPLTYDADDAQHPGTRLDDRVCVHCDCIMQDGDVVDIRGETIERHHDSNFGEDSHRHCHRYHCCCYENKA